MTHGELVARAQRWLRNTRHNNVVLAEIGSDGREQPDLIAWKYRGRICTVVECKTSRADFKRDAKKSFRMRGGMGSERFYATPPGLLTLAELPPSWGLIEVGPKLVRVVRTSGRFVIERNIAGETACLVSAIERVTDGWGRKVFGEISPVHGLPDPHPTVATMIHELRADNRALRAKVRRLEARLETRAS